MSMKRYPKVVVVKKNGRDGSEFPLTSGRCSIGRNPDCDICIQKMPDKDPVHCLVVVDGHEQAHLVNVNGMPGLALNKRPVLNAASLAHGDFFAIHNRLFRFEWCLKHAKKPATSADGAPAAAESKWPRRSGEASVQATPDRVQGLSTGVSVTPRSLGKSSYETPRIPPEMFVSPLTTSSLSGAAKSVQKSALKRLHVSNIGDGTPAKHLSWLDNGTCSKEPCKKTASACASPSSTPGGRLSRRLTIDGKPEQGLSEQAHVSKQQGLSASTPLQKTSVSLVSRSHDEAESDGETPGDESARSRPGKRNSKSAASRHLSSLLKFGGEGSYWALDKSSTHRRTSSLKGTSPETSQSYSSNKVSRRSASVVEEEESPARHQREHDTKRGSSRQGVKTPQAVSPKNVGVSQGSPERSARSFQAASPRAASRQSTSISQIDETSSSSLKDVANSPVVAPRQSTSAAEKGKGSRSPNQKKAGANRGSPVRYSRAESSEVASRQSMGTSKRGDGVASPCRTNIGTDHESFDRSLGRLPAGNLEMSRRSESTIMKDNLSPGQKSVSIDHVSPERSLRRSQHASPVAAPRQSRSSTKKGRGYLSRSPRNSSIGNGSPVRGKRSQAASPEVVSRQSGSTPNTGRDSASHSQRNVGVRRSSLGHSPGKSPAGNLEQSHRSEGSLSPRHKSVSVDHVSPERSLRRSQHASPVAAPRQSRSTTKEAKGYLSHSPRNISIDNGSTIHGKRSQAASPEIASRQSVSTPNTDEDSASHSRKNVSIRRSSSGHSPGKSQPATPEVTSRQRKSLPKKAESSPSPTRRSVSFDDGSPQCSLRKWLPATPEVASHQRRSAPKKGKSSPSPSRKDTSIIYSSPELSPGTLQSGSMEVTSRRSRSVTKKGKDCLSRSSRNTGVGNHSFDCNEKSQAESPMVIHQQSTSTPKLGKGSPSPSRKNVSIYAGSPEVASRRSGSTLKTATGSSSSPNQKYLSLDHGSPDHSPRTLQPDMSEVASRRSRSTPKKNESPSPTRRDTSIVQSSPVYSPRTSQGGTPRPTSRRSRSATKKGASPPSHRVMTTAIDRDSPRGTVRVSLPGSVKVHEQLRMSVSKKAESSPSPGRHGASPVQGSRGSRVGDTEADTRRSKSTPKGSEESPSLSSKNDRSFGHRMRKLEVRSLEGDSSQVKSTIKARKVSLSPNLQPDDAETTFCWSTSPSQKGRNLPSPNRKDIGIAGGSPERSARVLEESASAKKGKGSPSPDRKDADIAQPSFACSTPPATPARRGRRVAKKGVSVASRSTRSARTEEISESPSSHPGGGFLARGPGANLSENVSPAKDVRGKFRAAAPKVEPSPLVKDAGSPAATTKARRGRPPLKRAAVQRESTSPSSPKAAKVTEDSPVQSPRVTRARKTAARKSPSKPLKRAPPSKRRGRAAAEESGTNGPHTETSGETNVVPEQSPTKGEAVAEKDSATGETTPARRTKATKKTKKALGRSKELRAAQSGDGGSPSRADTREGGAAEAVGSVPARGRRKAAVAAAAALGVLTPVTRGRGKRQAAADEGGGTPSHRVKRSTVEEPKETEELPVKRRRGKRV